MSDYDSQPMPFKTTNYEYQISLGSVMDRKAISWDTRVYTKTWDDAKEIIDAHKETTEYPAIEVDARWRPTKMPGED